MPKVRIIGPVDDKIRGALLTLLAEAGFEILEGDPPEDAGDGRGPLDAAGDERESTVEGDPLHGINPCEEDASIVVLSPEVLHDGVIELAMRKAAARGCHVVGIWPPGMPAGSLPRPFEDYGGDTIVWDPVRLRDVVSMPRTPPSWSLPDDRPRPERSIKRHKC